MQYAENTYLLVKENGIKSTINFQLNFIKPKKKEEESLPEMESIHKASSKKETTIKKTSLEKKADEMFKKKDHYSPSKTRNVSLPNLKINHKDSKYHDKQRAKKRENRQKHKMASKNREK